MQSTKEGCFLFMFVVKICGMQIKPRSNFKDCNIDGDLSAGLQINALPNCNIQVQSQN